MENMAKEAVNNEEQISPESRLLGITINVLKCLLKKLYFSDLTSKIPKTWSVDAFLRDIIILGAT